VHGSLFLAPAIQINYDFHHKVTPERLDQLLEDIRRARAEQKVS
jgi:NADH-quinone oxidoreductase subunit E